MEKCRYSILKKVIVITLVVIFFLIFYYRFGDSIDNKICRYFIKNEDKFTLLKDETLTITNKYLLIKERSEILDLINNNSKIDSLKQILKIETISFFVDENHEIKEIIFVVNFDNYIGSFEYNYKESGIEEFKEKDLSIVRLKLNGYKKWGTTRSHRRGLFWVE